MLPFTEKLWTQQNQHGDDRRRLFEALAAFTRGGRVLYPGSFVDVAASQVFDDVTYVDIDGRAARFFTDDAGIAEILGPRRAHAIWTFVAGDYTTDLGLEPRSFDVLLSLYTGLVSDHCAELLRVGGVLLAHPSHGDVAMAAVDPRYELVGVILGGSGRYHVSVDALDEYLVPKRDEPPTPAEVRNLGKGIAYTKPAFAYLFERRS